MIISQIKYDRVTLYTSDSQDVYHGCLVSLEEDGDAKIAVMGDVSSSWLCGQSIVLRTYRLVELTPWGLVFDADMAKGTRFRDVRVVCEFNMFLSVSVRREKPKSLKGIKMSGNRVCEVCGQTRGLSSFHGHNECDGCSDKALQAYCAVQEKMKEGGKINWYLMPSKGAYMKDYLVRMKEERERGKG
jgi:hypothetical protein